MSGFLTQTSVKWAQCQWTHTFIIHTYTHTHTYTCTHMCIHRDTHTHTHIWVYYRELGKLCNQETVRPAKDSSVCQVDDQKRKSPSWWNPKATAHSRPWQKPGVLHSPQRGSKSTCKAFWLIESSPANTISLIQNQLGLETLITSTRLPHASAQIRI